MKFSYDNGLQCVSFYSLFSCVFLDFFAYYMDSENLLIYGSMRIKILVLLLELIIEILKIN